jgi:hypothetical protein
MALGVAGAAIVAVGGTAAALVRPVWSAGKFLGDGATVLGAVGKAVLEGTLPTESAAQNAALAKLVQGIEGVLANFPSRTQAEFVQLVTLLAHPWGRRALGMQQDFASASTAEIAAWLQSLRSAPLAVQQQAYHGLHDITLAAYFADPAVWQSIGYELPIKL